MASRFFKANKELALRSGGVEKRLSYSSFHKSIVIFSIALLLTYTFLLTTKVLIDTLKPASEQVVSDNIRNEYEERIHALVEERDNLAQTLEENKGNTFELVENLGNQQEMLFDQERENYELTLNLDNLRKQLVKSQNRLDAINLQINAQNEQINQLANGQNITDSSTLSAITTALTETALARDEARDEVQDLRQQIQANKETREAQDKSRDILFAQIEDAIQSSLSPMRSTLSKTGLNVDSVLRDVKRSYSGVGGVDADANGDIFGNSEINSARIDKLVKNLDQLSLVSHAIRSLPLGKPVKSNYRMSSAFGYRTHPITKRRKMHSGQDMAGPVGTKIYAPGAGTVIQAGWNAGYGKTIQIRHAYGIETLYGHLSKINVNVGEHVNLGDVIGRMGSTGQSTGSHLHYEVKVNGTKVNPMNFLRASKYVQ